VSGAEVSSDASIFARTGPGMSFPPTPSVFQILKNTFL